MVQWEDKLIIHLRIHKKPFRHPVTACLIPNPDHRLAAAAFPKYVPQKWFQFGGNMDIQMQIIHIFSGVAQK